MNKVGRILFTGERMIPDINRGAAFYYEHVNRYQFASQFVRNKSVLDLACGTGYGSHIISSSGATRVVGLDISRETISYANKKYKTPNTRFQVADALKTGLPDKSMDIVVCLEFIEHITAQDRLIGEIKRVLKQGGILIISTPNKLTYPKNNTFHKKELNINEFRRILSKHFKCINTFGQFFWFLNFITGTDLQLDESGIFPEYNKQDSQYYIAVCSDQDIGIVHPSFLASPSVDGIDISSGIQHLSQLVGQVNNLQAEIREITSSKTYKVWQAYCQFRDRLLKRN